MVALIERTMKVIGRSHALRKVVISVQEYMRIFDRDREGVTVLLNDVRYSALVEFGCISFRIV